MLRFHDKPISMIAAASLLFFGGWFLFFASSEVTNDVSVVGLQDSPGPSQGRVAPSNADYSFFNSMGYSYGDKLGIHVEFDGKHDSLGLSFECTLNAKQKRFGATGDGPNDFAIVCAEFSVPPELDGIYLFTANFGSPLSDFLSESAFEKNFSVNLQPTENPFNPDGLLAVDSVSGLKFSARFDPLPGKRSYRPFYLNPNVNKLNLKKVTIEIEGVY
jgi:hypothetical protein